MLSLQEMGLKILSALYSAKNHDAILARVVLPQWFRTMWTMFSMFFVNKKSVLWSET